MLASDLDDVADMVPVDAIFGRRPASMLWPSSQPVLEIAVEVLPTIEDALTADLVERLACALIEHGDELRAVRDVLSSALALSHTQHVEIVRLQAALARLLDEFRFLRVQTLQAAA